MCESFHPNELWKLRNSPHTEGWRRTKCIWSLHPRSWEAPYLEDFRPLSPLPVVNNNESTESASWVMQDWSAQKFARNWTRFYFERVQSTKKASIKVYVTRDGELLWIIINSFIFLFHLVRWDLAHFCRVLTVFGVLNLSPTNTQEMPIIAHRESKHKIHSLKSHKTWIYYSESL